ncbi:hypothetical protein L6R53_30165, partial [Myxococcota bacterium]|nr:hypothetical protein [Myxococcota bacterium]
ALAARVATARAGSLGRAGYLLLVLALVDAGLRVGLPWRQASRLGGAPPALEAGEGPVLDLLPLAPPAGDDPSSLLVARASCVDQAWHGRAIADECIRTDDAGRGEAQTWLQATLWDGQPDAQALAAAGFSAVVFRPDLFRAGDRQRLSAALLRLDPSPAVSTDGGQRAEVYALSAPAPAVATPLPPARPARAIGAAARPLALASTLQVVLIGAPGDGEATVTLHLPDGSTATAPLEAAQGASAGDDAPPRLARFSRSLPGALELQVDAGEAGTWRGPVHLVEEDEQLTFEARAGTLWPVATTPVLSPTAPVTTPRAAVRASLALLALLLAGAVILHAARRDRAWRLPP